MVTDPPTDDTEAQEQDAPDTTGVKHGAPLHGHTGAVPPDKALSDTPLCSAGKKMTSPSASQVKAHSLWPQTTSLARGDPTSPSWRQLGKHTSAHQPIEKGGQRSAPEYRKQEG
eukprot:scaffold15242_cov138-Isochrysis_galbana.AAC.3